MSQKTDYLPFPIGSTMGVSGASDQAHWEGMEFEVECRDYSQNPAPAFATLIGARLRLRIVRNVSPGTFKILPSALCTFKTGSGEYGGQVDGQVNATAAECYPADMFLPAAGVAVNDLFYIVVDGPTKILNDLAAGANNLLPAGTVVVGLTAVTSEATTSGRLAPQDLTGATALLGAQIQNAIGVVITGLTTNQTNTGCWVYVKQW